MKAGKIGKTLKIVLWTLGGLLAVVVLALLTIPLWIGPVVTGTANSQVPALTGTGFHLGEFGLNPYSGRVHVGDLQLQNPKRFFEREEEEKKEDEGVLAGAWNATKKLGSAVSDLVSSPETNALTFASIDVSLKPTSLVTDTIVIESIVIKDLYLYASAPLGGNWKEIVGKLTEGAEEKEEKKESNTKVVIDRIEIQGLCIKWGSITVNLTDPIVIRDIGKDEPATEEGAFDSLVDGVCTAVESVSAVAGKGLKALYSACKALTTGAADLASGGLEAVKDGAEAVKNLIPGLGK